MTARWNFPWLAAALALLVTGTLAGLMRIGWALPPLSTGLIADHGPLMLTGFLGTLITLERAVALGRRRHTLGAAFFSAGGLLIATGLADFPARLMTLLGSIGLVLIFALILRQHREMHTWVMAAGALFLLVGSLLWALGWGVVLVVPWWMAFPVLTIAGERLELGRLLALSPPGKRLFTAAAGLFGVGVILTAFTFDVGTRIAGAGMVSLAVWHLRFDLARKTVRKPGLTRFIALCMLGGYVWLLAGGLLAVMYGAELAGPRYDAQLHTIFLGFVFSMIFGHAPIIFPAILGRQVRYEARFYVHLVLLHVSLALRVIGDLGGAGMPAIASPRLAAMLNGIALLVFLVNTVISVAVRGRQ